MLELVHAPEHAALAAQLRAKVEAYWPLLTMRTRAASATIARPNKFSLFGTKGSRKSIGLMGYHALCQSNWSPPGVTTAAVSAAAGSETLARRDNARARARTLFGAHQAFRKPFGVRRDERGVPRTACARGDAIGKS